MGNGFGTPPIVDNIYTYFHTIVVLLILDTGTLLYKNEVEDGRVFKHMIRRIISVASSDFYSLLSYHLPTTKNKHSSLYT